MTFAVKCGIILTMRKDILVSIDPRREKPQEPTLVREYANGKVRVYEGGKFGAFNRTEIDFQDGTIIVNKNTGMDKLRFGEYHGVSVKKGKTVKSVLAVNSNTTGLHLHEFLSPTEKVGFAFGLHPELALAMEAGIDDDQLKEAAKGSTVDKKVGVYVKSSLAFLQES